MEAMALPLACLVLPRLSDEMIACLSFASPAPLQAPNEPGCRGQVLVAILKWKKSAGCKVTNWC